MPIAITPATTWDWQLEEDRADDGSIDEANTVWFLGALTAEQEAKIEDLGGELVYNRENPTSGEVVGRMRRGSSTLEILRHGLRGWRNFPDASGVDVKWESAGGNPPRCKTSCMDYISSEHRAQLANAITERQRVTPTEGNSSRPSSDTHGATTSPTAPTADETTG